MLSTHEKDCLQGDNVFFVTSKSLGKMSSWLIGGSKLHTLQKINMIIIFAQDNDSKDNKVEILYDFLSSTSRYNTQMAHYIKHRINWFNNMSLLLNRQITENFRQLNPDC